MIHYANRHLLYLLELCCWWWCPDETRWAVVSGPVSGAESPAGRHSHSAVVHRRRMWIYGGLSDLTALDDLWTWHFGAYSYLHLATSEMWCWSGGRKILTELSLCYSIVYHYNPAQWYEQFFTVGRLDRTLILLVLAPCPPSTSSGMYKDLAVN